MASAGYQCQVKAEPDLQPTSHARKLRYSGGARRCVQKYKPPEVGMELASSPYGWSASVPQGRRV